MLYEYSYDLTLLNSFSPPDTTGSLAAITTNPLSNKIHILTTYNTDSTLLGIRTFNTSTNEYITEEAYTRHQSPVIQVFPASCTSTTRPINPFIGQMVFITNLSPAIAVWWNGTNWVDNQGVTK
jgi:hypothetical protein